MGKLAVGILGATGAAGLEFVRALSDHPFFEIAELYASEKSAGKTLEQARKLDLSGLPARIRTKTVQNVEDVSSELDVLHSPLMLRGMLRQNALHTRR